MVEALSPYDWWVDPSNELGDWLSRPENLGIDEATAVAPHACHVAETMTMRALMVAARTMSFRLEKGV